MITKSKLSSTLLAMAAMFSGCHAGSLLAPRAARRPTGKELRNSADPHQATRIQAAADKRTRKAAKLDRDLNRSAVFNAAHRAPSGGDVPYGSNHIWHRLNPLYVNR